MKKKPDRTTIFCNRVNCRDREVDEKQFNWNVAVRTCASRRIPALTRHHVRLSEARITALHSGAARHFFR